MGDVSPLSLLVTGAGGFLGAATVRAALARGHSVRAVIRREAARAALPEAADVRVFDLNTGGDALAQSLGGVDAVIHLAASLSGDPAVQDRDTLGGTRALLGAIKRRARPPRLVLASSIAVYSSDGALEGQVIDEDTPLESEPAGRDTYCRAKLAQEALVRGAAGHKGFDLWILRPGAIYGPGHLWNAHIGPAFGPVVLRLGRSGEVPLSHVDHSADAMVLAAERRARDIAPDGPGVVNVLDDDLPDRAGYLAALRRSGWPRLVLPGSWRMLARVAGLAGLAGLTSGPGLLRPATLRARMMPVRYDNTRARTLLGWQPRHSFAQAMQHAIAAGGGRHG